MADRRLLTAASVTHSEKQNPEKNSKVGTAESAMFVLGAITNILWQVALVLLALGHDILGMILAV